MKRVDELTVVGIGAFGFVVMDDVHKDYTEGVSGWRLGNTCFEVVDESRAELDLSLGLEDAQDGLDESLLLRVEILKEV